MSTATARPSSETYAERAAAESALVLTPTGAASALAVRAASYVELTKPRISVMVLLTVMVGYTVGCEGDWRLSVLLPVLVGVALVASGSSALNQYLERVTDGAMARTSGRPLPSGSLTAGEALLFGIVCGAAGTMWLAATVNVLTSLLTLGTLLLYVGLYTPLKRRTSLCTVVGAVPGALPPVLGWTAARGSLDAEAFALFAILFLWQFPHFLAIAWLYRDQYERAGLRMLPRRRSAHVMGLLAVTYALTLVVVSLLPSSSAMAGDLYATSAVILGLIYAAGAAQFAWRGTRRSARELLWASLVYLPGLLLVLTYDHLRLLM